MKTVYFGSLPKNAFIYENSFTDNYAYIYKYKVLKKTTISTRLNGRFGGPKVTKVILELQCVEYQNHPYFSGYTFEVELNAHSYVAGYLGHTYYSDFEEFKKALYYKKCALERSTKLIEEYLKE